MRSWPVLAAQPASACSPSTRRNAGPSTWSPRSKPPSTRDTPHPRRDSPYRWRLEMWGIIPAAGLGSRIQPLAFSKELLPVGSRIDQGVERPCAVSEYLLERMILGGADKICFVISPGKSDILEYFGDSYSGASIVYLVQPKASGLCDAIFRAQCVVAADEPVIVGLPDTIWFPK